MPDSILAMHVRQNILRPSDREAEGDIQNENDPEAQQTTSNELMISAVDDSENVYVFFHN